MDLASVKAVFLDVACKFEGYYKRIYEELDLPAGLPFAIGPWHIRPHKPECNVRCNSRYMPGLGLTFGDLIEHLWADNRRHWYITAYMSPAARQDFINGLPVTLFRKGANKNKIHCTQPPTPPRQPTDPARAAAAEGDACLGLRHFKAAASGSLDLQPLAAGDLFISEKLVMERLKERGKMADPDAVSCSKFKAAKVFGRRAANYDRLGVAAFACRHGFVPAMVSLHTEEDFVYYEVLLEALKQRMDLASVKAVFLDVACKFEGYYKRIYEELDLPAGLPFAIGPWHIRPHKPECNVRCNSRYMPGLGLTFGDLIEHLWADNRRHWYITAYMSPAARQDFINGLPVTLFRKGANKNKIHCTQPPTPPRQPTDPGRAAAAEGRLSF
ncbi:hypothetical protein VOLCADRAFT_97223 [Volvox carteri f. nagariensis]|uniref:Uncharacterized protein n=1 Tax=Volvox carteri f. nagariensis TaxID=3068 RepID=D8UC68_VOLCA|nr:uncharacterized protein VOLCADRAFT_97223 [Volvox carteri f. nagariensis]EFJ42598.1 hypothetical protein VOLCADRAFT_97223 [Volvox carteri f. nagariensis]|eukprot:XP_002956249.1 hypothetical protein VOLCADRAFT_97223 [Volvox carteri f. nagariensis]